jgi:hypothetical protein
MVIMSGCSTTGSDPVLEDDLLPVHEWGWAYDFADVQRIDDAFKTHEVREAFGCPEEIPFHEVRRAHVHGAHRWLWLLQPWCPETAPRAEGWMAEGAREGDEYGVLMRELARGRERFEEVARMMSNLTDLSPAEFELAGYLMSRWILHMDGLDLLSEGLNRTREERPDLVRPFYLADGFRTYADRLEFLVTLLAQVAEDDAPCLATSAVDPEVDLVTAREAFGVLEEEGFREWGSIGEVLYGMRLSLRGLEESHQREWAPLAVRAAQDWRLHHLTAWELQDAPQFPRLDFTPEERAEGIRRLNEAVLDRATQWNREYIDWAAYYLLNPEETSIEDYMAQTRAIGKVPMLFEVTCT